MTTEYHEAARRLARAHAQDAADDLRIFLFPDPASQTIRLVEVSASHPAEEPDATQAWAVHFSPGGGFDLYSAVILLTPEDWRRIHEQRLLLPDGWSLVDMEQVWPE